MNNLNNCNGKLHLNSYDHRQLGKSLDLFSFKEEGPGFPIFHHNGLILKNLIIDYWRNLHNDFDYLEIESPQMLDKELWKKSGHWDLYKEHMYISENEHHDFAIKPMNCPGAILFYQGKRRSFKELPLKVCELGKVHRKEDSGSLHGLMRARSFIVDDAHIFCESHQIQDQVEEIIEMIFKILKDFNFNDFEFELSIRSEDKKEKYLGDDADWISAQESLISSLKKFGISPKVMEGEAKFYGPALDLQIKDSHGRNWQCASIQLDFNLAKRFGLSYYDKDGNKKIPVIIHRAVLGSLERFIGVLLEQYQGQLPFWLRPVQVAVLPINEDHKGHSQKLCKELKKQGFRIKHLDSQDNLSERMKKNHEINALVMILIGDKEVKNSSYAIKYQGKQMNISNEDLIDFLESL